jgi:hypothetical protein
MNKKTDLPLAKQVIKTILNGRNPANVHGDFAGFSIPR